MSSLDPPEVELEQIFIEQEVLDRFFHHVEKGFVEDYEPEIGEKIGSEEKGGYFHFIPIPGKDSILIDKFLSEPNKSDNPWRSFRPRESTMRMFEQNGVQNNFLPVHSHPNETGGYFCSTKGDLDRMEEYDFPLFAIALQPETQFPHSEETYLTFEVYNRTWGDYDRYTKNPQIEVVHEAEVVTGKYPQIELQNELLEETFYDKWYREFPRTFDDIENGSLKSIHRPN